MCISHFTITGVGLPCTCWVHLAVISLRSVFSLQSATKTLHTSNGKDDETA